MVRYETLMLARTQITDDELAAVEKQFDAVATGVKGSVDSFDKWGKYRLAYPVGKSDYGIYVLARFSIPKQALAQVNKKLDTFFKIKCHEFIMRHVTKRIAAHAPAQYPKPEALDAKPAASLDSFIKDNKMEGILNTQVESEPQEQPVEKPAEHAQTEPALVEDSNTAES